jgi:uncharacterized membrane-anchored protein YjiN (DUF445 family)
MLLPNISLSLVDDIIKESTHPLYKNSTAQVNYTKNLLSDPTKQLKSQWLKSQLMSKENLRIHS